MSISQRRVVTVFLGSPGDLTDERSAARAVVDELNRSLRDLDWQIDLLGWEDTLPGRARPQELINDDIKRCNLFIGALWHRWGSPTGKFSSGFEEEYELARRLANDGGEPEIWLLLKEIDPDRLADPGEQLTCVLGFRSRVEQQREVFYKAFTDVDKFATMLRELLLRYIFRLQSAITAPQLGSPQEPPVGKSGRSEGPGASEGDTEQAVSTLRSIADAIIEGTPIEAWEAARLRLTASTVFSNSYSPEAAAAHPVNVLYSSTRELVLSHQEIFTVVRSILSGWDTVPGWRWTTVLDDEALLAGIASIAATDEDERVRAASIRMLTHARVLPMIGPSDGDSGLAKRLLSDSSPSVVSVAVDYLAAVLADSETVDALLPVLGEEQASLQARLLRSTDPARAVAVLVSSSSHLSDSDLRNYSDAAQSADETLLRAALTDRRASVRVFALRELVRRDVLGLPDISERLADSSMEVRREAARAFIRNPSTKYEDARAVVERVNPEHPWQEDALIRDAVAKLDSDALAESIYLFDADGDEAYAILGERGDPRIVDRLRSDLADDFGRLRDESVARLTAQHGEEVAKYISERSADVEKFVLAQRAGAALSTLAAIATSADALLARKYLPSKWDFVRLPAIEILSAWGTADDGSALLAVAEQAYGAVREAATRALLAVDPAMEAHAASLLKSDDPLHLRAALRQLLEVAPDRAEEAARLALYSDKEPIRRVGLATLLRLYDRDALSRLVVEYQEAKRYLYDVVVWLDTVLFAPSSLAAGFRRYIEDELAATE